jgi:hypothetical protein
MKNKISNNQAGILKALGAEYRVVPIDLEPCIYRKINGNDDIEVSGTRLNGKPMTIYVCDISGGKYNGAHIVETVKGIIGISALQAALDGIGKKYTGQVRYDIQHQPKYKKSTCGGQQNAKQQTKLVRTVRGSGTHGFRKN